MNDSPDTAAAETSGIARSDQPDVADIPDSLDRLGALAHSTRAPDTLVQKFCQQLVATMPSADMAGVTLVPQRGTKAQTAACTDPRVLDLELDQYRIGEGPSLESARTAQLVRADSATADKKWPDFTQHAAKIGIASYLSVPLRIDDRHVGVLSLYSMADHGFVEIDAVVLQVFVAAVEGAVWKARKEKEWRDEIAGLRAAMKSRGHIEQAKGMLMVMHAITEDQAFDMLAAQSQRQNIRLTTVAAQIIQALSGQPGT